MEERLDFALEEKRRSGVSVAVVTSVVLHALFVTWIALNYHPVSQTEKSTPMTRYIELIRQNPQFTEAPGPRVASAPINAPFSDANRRASTPEPTGDRPTNRPGSGGFYVPPMKSGDSRQPSEAQPSQREQPQSSATPASEITASNPNSPQPTFTYRPPVKASSGASIDWRGAIREVGKIASLGTDQHGVDLSGSGGDKGFAESGPLSFESQWYNWGEYAESMVSKIRVNWYNNMPQLIQTGMKGVVTIRFTIQRDGQITELEILNTSTIPPYDFAAKKAIQLASPLNPLPKDFPNRTERVTCMFFYNQEPPTR